MSVLSDPVYYKFQDKFSEIKAAANLDNIILMDSDLRILVDATGELPSGERYLMAEADQAELESVWDGNVVTSLLYPGKYGRLYKSAYAPVMDSKDRRVVAALRVEASAEFLEIIETLSFVLFMGVLIITALAALIGMLIARSIVVPIKTLVRASERIANGELDTEVVIRSRDEIGFFARTFNQMARNLKKSYEEVEERGRQIAELSASVAHEVRSPISAIQGFTELLEDELENDDVALEYTTDIKGEIKVLNSKITDFIHFAKPLSIDLIPLDIIVVIESALASMEKEIYDNAVSIVTNFSSAMPNALGDFDQLRSLFTNLIRNGIQSMNAGGTLIISASFLEDKEHHNMGFIEIKIEDTGCGMDSEALQRAFEPFFTTKGRGTGLGLAIVKKIVDVHKGSIELKSDVGIGTTVKVRLPADGNFTV
jgi:signal transduction histidine kinase